MNSKHIVLSAIIGAVVVAVAAFGFYAIDLALSQKPVAQPLGAANVSAYTAMNNQNLVNQLNLIANPLVAIQSTTTPAIGFSAVGSSTGALSTSTVLSIPANVGDQVLLQPSTSSPGFYFIGSIVTGGAATSALQILAINGNTGAAVAPSSTTFFVKILPTATFIAPSGL